MASDERNVSGTWKGVFNYPRLLPPGQFDAELREYGGVLTGETVERSNDIRRGSGSLHAMLEGHRHGDEVRFLKYYDALQRAKTPVQYHGTVSADGSEISGKWDIPSQWSGTFLMIRAKPIPAVAERKISEVVR